jgi:hypothetical protein
MKPQKKSQAIGLALEGKKVDYFTLLPEEEKPNS